MRRTLAGLGIAATLATGGGVTADQIINPYETTTTIEDGKTVEVLQNADVSSVKDGGINEAILDTSKPKMTLSKWDGQAMMGVTYDGLQATGARKFLSKDVEWSDAEQTMQVVQVDPSSTLEDGGYELNIMLKSMPSSNQFNFSIEGSEQLDFLYQPPLWQEAGLSEPAKDCTDTECTLPGHTSERPENVVGSYAVYYKDHADHIDGETNYATGKAYHIYRPLITDADGKSVWGILSYSDGTLSVTVPPDFLETATYPVKVDPTFGYTSQGASDALTCGSGGDGADGMRGIAISGTLSSISAYMKVNSAAIHNTSYGLDLYSEVSSKPGVSLASASGGVYANTTYQLKTLSVSYTMTGANYWAVASCSFNQDPGRVAFDSGGTAGSGANGDLGAAWTADSNRYSVYTTYSLPTTPTANPYNTVLFQ